MNDDSHATVGAVMRGSSVSESSQLGNVPLAVFLAETDKTWQAKIEAIDTRIAFVERIIETRLNAMDKAMTLFEENLTRVPTDVDRQVSHLRELNTERFDSIALQFSERDVRVEQTARDTRVAVDAALQAAKEAVAKQNENFSLSIDKSDAATAKQIDSLGGTLRTATGGLEGQIGDLKDRLTRIEAAGTGRSAAVIENRALTGDNRAGTAQVLSFVGAGIGLLLFLMAIATFVIANG